MRKSILEIHPASIPRLNGDHNVSRVLVDRYALLEQYREVRKFTESLCETLEPEDCVIQSMPEASPTKWHLAHTSCFFETFVLKAHFPNFQPAHPQYAYLFNTFHNAANKMLPPAQRGLMSRPTVKATFVYREHVDSMMEKLLENSEEDVLQKIAPLVTLGLNHEQRHQERILTDIKHAFFMNPLRPAYHEYLHPAGSAPSNLRWHNFSGGNFAIGHQGASFCFENETPRHRVHLEDFALATRLVTNGEYLAFVEDGGYQHPEWWLSPGWTTVAERNWSAPLYWEKRSNGWWQMTLAGMRKLDVCEPVCAVSYFEADAFARWANARLPTEAEWEIAAAEVPIEGNFAEGSYFHPTPPDHTPHRDILQQMYGDLWQWTRSPYSPYPGYTPAGSVLGEYNGKFMSNQYVLRGASCATPQSHARRTYRNFLPPDARWQFAGIRLARD